MIIKSFAVVVLGLAHFFAQLDCSVTPDGRPSSGPIEPAVVAYLADHLEPKECAQLSKFLALESTNSDSKENENAKSKLDGQKVQSFPCHHALKLWTYGIAKPKLQSSLDGGEEYTATVLKLGLKQVKRNDLVAWMDKITRERIHEEVSAMEREEALQKRVGDGYDYSFFDQDNNEGSSELIPKIKGRSRNRNLKKRLRTTMANIEDDDEFSFEDLPPSLVYVMIVSGVGMFVIIVLGFSTCFCARRKHEVNSRPGSRNMSSRFHQVVPEPMGLNVVP